RVCRPPGWLWPLYPPLCLHCVCREALIRPDSPRISLGFAIPLGEGWLDVWCRRSMLVGLVIAVAVSAVLLAPAHAAGRFYAQTGFSIDDPAFQDYFDHRGGLRTFGYPVSRAVKFLGFPVPTFHPPA